VNHPLPGKVWIQLLSLPAGASGPKYTSIEPSALGTAADVGYDWLPALSAYRWNPIIAGLHQRMLGCGMSKMTIIVA